jgi:hypothetical protein
VISKAKDAIEMDPFLEVYLDKLKALKSKSTKRSK